MLKGLFKILALNWFLVWTVVIIFVGYGLSPDRTARKRLLVNPEWIGAEGKAYDGRSLLEVLESPFEVGDQPENLGELIAILQKIVPVEIGRTLLVLCREDRITFAKKELPIIDYPVGCLAEYLDRTLSPLDIGFGIRDRKLFIGIENESRHQMTRFYPCPKLMACELSDAITSALGTSQSNWDVDGGEDTLRFIKTDQQTILAVAASYGCHRDIQPLIEKLNAHAGTGFVDDVTWKDRVIGLIDQACFRSGSSVPSNGGMGMGFGMSGGF